ncbi:unnamed protein product [Haemonchus placei]|uniref:ZnMc domain-containing protein n=1 Tax=Haemonchus placei TaxID=6290 RepID=A0A0N4X2D7_HAEPC|nr:unnamed protein product [Haemonchus placei]
MRLFILALSVAVCVSGGLVGGRIGSVKENVTNEILGCSMLEFRKRLAAYEEKHPEELELSEEQRRKLAEKLKTLKRKTVGKSLNEDSIETINMKSHVADMLFQGDMVLSKEQQDQILEDVAHTRGKRQARSNKTYRWHEGVSYFFDDSANDDVRRIFKKAAKQWMDSTCVDFKESKSDQRMVHLNSRGLAKDRIGVFMGNGCWSYVGKIGGLQNLSLGKGCEELWIWLNSSYWKFKSLTFLLDTMFNWQIFFLVQRFSSVQIRIAAHEIGHALGFFHTHNRHDRDDYITVDIGNIKPDKISLFETLSKVNNNNYGVPYDYGSVMHYGASSNAVDDEKLVVVPKDLNYTETLGSPHISFYDIYMMNIHYNCLDDGLAYAFQKILWMCQKTQCSRTMRRRKHPMPEWRIRSSSCMQQMRLSTWIRWKTLQQKSKCLFQLKLPHISKFFSRQRDAVRK